jgi:HD-GYP domain-containing protein (c-di-GMP phosphodiesterase class II)
MYPDTAVNLGNLLLSLSDAIDLVSPIIASHQQRTAYIAWKICKAAKLSPATTERVFVAGLLHDVGALTSEEKINIQNFDVKETKPHCLRGERLFNNVPWLRDSAKIVRYHHREWQKWNQPIDAPYVLESQILFLADYLERLIDRRTYILHQHQRVLQIISNLSGTAVHPSIINFLKEASHSEVFWLELTSPRLYSLLLHRGPYRELEIDLPGIGVLAELFRNIVDFKSRFTSTHSCGVAVCASILAEKFGLTPTEVKLIEVAGDLHDIGKLVVPSSILDKRERLSEDDFAVIRQHPYHTFTILNTIDGLEPIAQWASFHHERLDGSGYPFGCRADRLSTPARIIIVADIFTALLEERPYRNGMEINELLKKLNKLAEAHLLDKQIVSLLFDNCQEIVLAVRSKQEHIKHYYERHFLPAG